MVVLEWQCGISVCPGMLQLPCPIQRMAQHCQQRRRPRIKPLRGLQLCPPSITQARLCSCACPSRSCRPRHQCATPTRLRSLACPNSRLPAQPRAAPLRRATRRPGQSRSDRAQVLATIARLRWRQHGRTLPSCAHMHAPSWLLSLYRGRASSMTGGPIPDVSLRLLGLSRTLFDQALTIRVVLFAVPPPRLATLSHVPIINRKTQ